MKQQRQSEPSGAARLQRFDWPTFCEHESVFECVASVVLDDAACGHCDRASWYPLQAVWLKKIESPFLRWGIRLLESYRC